jgi:hypothetical protein
MNDGNAFSIKDLITVVPVAAIILAAMYDFGFFAAVDASLFSLFSWSDHVVFALESVFPAIVIVSALGWSLSKFTFDAPMNQQPRTRLWFLVVLFGLLTVTSLLITAWGSAMFWGLMFLITLIAMFVKVSLSGIVLAYSLGLVFGAFALGNESGHAALHVRSEQSLVTTNNEVQGRVFRSGERGVAFYDRTTKKVSFLLWGEVKRLETAFVECQGIC